MKGDVSAGKGNRVADIVKGISDPVFPFVQKGENYLSYLTAVKWALCVLTSGLWTEMIHTGLLGRSPV